MSLVFRIHRIVLVMLLLILAGCNSNKLETTDAANEQIVPPAPIAGKQLLGFTIFNFDNTFMTGIRNSITAVAEGKAQIEILDSQNSLSVEMDRISSFVENHCRAIAVNPVERTNVKPIIQLAKKQNIPIVFFNREPSKDDLSQWDKLYYVGAKAEESGLLEGSIAVDYWKNTPTADKNKDGIMQYVMLQGEPGHQDVIMRTKYSISAVTQANIKVEALAQESAMWDRIKAQEKMSSFLALHGDKIEFVFANNDDMALGAIEALKTAGYFKNGKFMPVVGVDDTKPALEALKSGTLLGTVLNDAKRQGEATFRLSQILGQQQVPTFENTGFTITDKKYIWIPYKKITRENFMEAEE